MSVPIINQPRAVTQHLVPQDGLYEVEYVAEQKKRMRALASRTSRIMCRHTDAAMIEVFPEWMCDAGPGLIKHARIRSRLTKEPLLGVQMLLLAYDETQPILERSVLSSGEATVPLLCAIDEGQIAPCGARDAYEYPLLEQPWWGLRYLSLPTENTAVRANRVKFGASLKKRCAERQGVSPQAALVHLLLNEEMNPSPHAELLCKEPMVAYLASRLLGPRGLDLKLDQVATLDARWATHIALWGGFGSGNVDSRIEESISEHAGWAGEYIARNELRQKDWNWVKEIYARVEAGYKQRAGSEPDLWADLLWALLDRLCLLVEGKEPRITFFQSFSRNAPPAAQTPPPNSAAPAPQN